jgi:hypothetical protein
MKPTPSAAKNESQRTVLMVDGHGQIRTIRKFHQKLRLGIALAVLSLVAAVGAVGLYIHGLQTQRALEDQITALRAEVAAAQHQKELLLARAIKAETQAAPRIAPPASAAPFPPGAPESGSKDISRPAPPATKPEPPPPVPVVKKPPPSPAAAPQTDAKPQPVVSVVVEDFKVAYQAAAKALTSTFVIRNTGNSQAQGRAVVVLSTGDEGATPRLSLPPVPLKGNRPHGNRGRRFSISRFMRLKLERKVAEPGLRYDSADVFVFDMQGKLLREQTFTVAVEIPAPEPEAPAATVTPEEPAAEQAVEPDASSILAIPANSGQEP